jgi:hypothetical protein
MSTKKIQAILLINDANDISKYDIKEIVYWLREQTKFIKKNGMKLSKTFRARLMK